MATILQSKPNFAIEAQLRRENIWPVAGVDEVGRGPLAGPVCAAAVILNPDDIPQGLNDSKLLSPRAREAAFDVITRRALAISFALEPPAAIDALNIRQASLKAMAAAIAGLALKPAHVLVDGRDLPAIYCSGQAIVKGDALSLSIAAASIVAKVVRDNLMRKLAEQHPDYGFATNAGYGAKQHLAALKSLGPTPHHRLSFKPCNA